MSDAQGNEAEKNVSFSHRHFFFGETTQPKRFR